MRFSVASSISLYILIFSLGFGARCFAQEMSGIGETEGQPFWRSFKNKFRLSYSSEFQTPAFRSTTRSVPMPDGDTFAPSCMFHIVAFEYEFTENTRLIYVQRAYLPFGTDTNFQGMQLLIRDPRIGIRRMKIFDNPNLSTSYDLFLQPQTSHNPFSTNNGLDIGVRLSNALTLKNSHWSIGFLADIVTSYHNPNGIGPRVYGFAAPWASYEITPKLTTQHWFNFGYRNGRAENNPWHRFGWDVPLPFMQNGINWNCTEAMSVALILNNYMVASPKLENTWVSVWFSLTML